MRIYSTYMHKLLQTYIYAYIITCRHIIKHTNLCRYVKMYLISEATYASCRLFKGTKQPRNNHIIFNLCIINSVNSLYLSFNRLASSSQNYWHIPPTRGSIWRTRPLTYKVQSQYVAYSCRNCLYDTRLSPYVLSHFIRYSKNLCMMTP